MEESNDLDQDFEELEAAKLAAPPVKQSKLRPKKSYLDFSSGDGGEDQLWLTSYADLMTLIACFFILLVAFANFDPQSFSRKAKEMAKHFSGDKPAQSEGLMEKIKSEIQTDPVLADAVKVSMELDGIALNFSGSALFEPGKADLRPEIRDTLDIVIDLIQEKNPEAKILVEGHTDDSPLANSSRYYNNWELSGARAARVVDRFERFGFPSKNLVALGYGSTRPLKPNHDTEGKAILENMQENRRVIIKVLDNPALLKRVKLGLGVYFDTDVVNK